jgi:hypothetical protein
VDFPHDLVSWTYHLLFVRVLSYLQVTGLLFSQVSLGMVMGAQGCAGVESCEALLSPSRE